jgi:hypothetical protein
LWTCGNKKTREGDIYSPSALVVNNRFISHIGNVTNNVFCRHFSVSASCRLLAPAANYPMNQRNLYMLCFCAADQNCAPVWLVCSLINYAAINNFLTVSKQVARNKSRQEGRKAVCSLAIHCYSIRVLENSKFQLPPLNFLQWGISCRRRREDYYWSLITWYSVVRFEFLSDQIPKCTRISKGPNHKLFQPTTSGLGILAQNATFFFRTFLCIKNTFF